MCILSNHNSNKSVCFHFTSVRQHISTHRHNNHTLGFLAVIYIFLLKASCHHLLMGRAFVLKWMRGADVIGHSCYQFCSLHWKAVWPPLSFSQCLLPAVSGNYCISTVTAFRMHHYTESDYLMYFDSSCPILSHICCNWALCWVFLLNFGKLFLCHSYLNLRVAFSNVGLLQN